MKRTPSKTFPKGGVHPPDDKISAHKPIQPLDIPEIVSIPISQHIGAPAKPLVRPQDFVKAGQLIAESSGFISANIHSSVSGTVLKIDDVPSLTGYKTKAVIIKTQGDEWVDDIDLSPDLKTEFPVSQEEITKNVLDAGIVGLGGATFPTHVKLSVPQGKKIEYLLVNGVECEPYLTSDHRLMLEKGREILVGIQILMKAVGTDQTYVGIEENKPDAIQLLSDIARNCNEEIEIVPLKVQYPQGGERQLIKALINREIPPPPKGLPIDAGCVVVNVGTVFAVYEAVQKNKPLVERVVTITGPATDNPSNFLVRIGTPVSHLISAAKDQTDSENTLRDIGKIISGGPMMGKALPSAEVPITKGTSGIVCLPADQSRRQEVLNCVRCGKCVEVCPLGLEPYLLMTLSEKAEWAKGEQERMLNCCECACCSYICPSNRPLLDYIRLGKSVVSKIVRSRGNNER